MEAKLKAASRDGNPGGDAPGFPFEPPEWIQRPELAALASDAWGCEVRPNETEPGINQPWHWITIPLMGMTMGEIFYVADLAKDCAEDGVYEFMFVAPASPITAAAGARPHTRCHSHGFFHEKIFSGIRPSPARSERWSAALPLEAGQDAGRVPARRPGRHHRAAHRAEDERDPRPASHRREQGRRERQRRYRGSRKLGSRRLHAARALIGVRGEPDAFQPPRLRPDQGPPRRRRRC